jgi:hypothetical protein
MKACTEFGLCVCRWAKRAVVFGVVQRLMWCGWHLISLVVLASTGKNEWHSCRSISALYIYRVGDVV